MPSIRDVLSMPSLETSRQMRLKRRLVDVVFRDVSSMPSFRDVSSDAVFRDVSSMPSLETSRRFRL